MGQSHTMKALKYILAPILIGLLAVVVIYGLLHISLPEDYARYGVVLTVFTFIILAFFLLSCMPCAIMAAFHGVCAMMKDRKFILPALLLLLDLGLIEVWGNVIEKILSTYA